MENKSTEVVVYEATQIWSSVEYGNGPHKAGQFFVQLCDYDAVVAERDELREKLAAVESQKPVPADKPARITEQDVQEIVYQFADFSSLALPRTEAINYLVSAEVRNLLNKLNADREQLPAVAVPVCIIEAIDWLKASVECANFPWDDDALEAAKRALDASLKFIAADKPAADKPAADKPAGDNGTGNVLWSDSHSEDEILEEHSDNALFDVVANLWEDIRCLKEDKPAVAVPDFETWWRSLPSYRDADKPAAKMAWDHLAGIIEAATSHSQQSVHPDDIAVDQFADVMKHKLAKARDKGRSGWESPSLCKVSDLATMLVDHLPKGDPVDVANFAMMLFFREGGNDALKDVCKFINSQQSAE